MTQIIAEAGVNHNGDVSLALDMIDIAADAGADWVKFQTFVPEEVISATAEKARYQKETTGSDQSQLDMVRPLRLDEDAHWKLAERCKKRGIGFLSTPFDLPSMEFLLDDMELTHVKVASGEVTNALLLVEIGRRGPRVFVSTGMCALAEVEAALGYLALGRVGAEPEPGPAATVDALNSNEGRAWVSSSVTLLHCTSAYPADPRDANLRAMDTLHQAFGLPAGLSDHTPGITIPIAAAGRGAAVIEKHFTLDRNMPGPDHRASLSPGELADMVAAVRDVESALGDGRKRMMPGETELRAIARKSLVARKPIHAGERLTAENLGAKRPGTGMSPCRYWDVIGATARRDIATDEQILPALIDTSSGGEPAQDRDRPRPP